MRALLIYPHEKRVVEKQIDEHLEAYLQGTGTMKITKVRGLSGRDALYTFHGASPPLHKFRVKGFVEDFYGSAAVVGHTLDGEMTSADSSKRAVGRLIAFP